MKNLLGAGLLLSLSGCAAVQKFLEDNPEPPPGVLEAVGMVGTAVGGPAGAGMGVAGLSLLWGLYRKYKGLPLIPFKKQPKKK